MITAEVEIKTGYQTYAFTLYNVKNYGELHDVVFQRVYTLTKEEQKSYIVVLSIHNVV